jgi:hypothetical protein
MLLSLMDLNFVTAESSERLYTDDMHLLDWMFRLCLENAGMRLRRMFEVIDIIVE